MNETILGTLHSPSVQQHSKRAKTLFPCALMLGSLIHCTQGVSSSAEVEGNIVSPEHDFQSDRDAIGDYLGIAPKDLQIAAHHTVNLKLSQKTISTYKIVAGNNKRLRRLSLDQTRSFVDLEAAMQVERELHTSTYGAATSRFYSKVLQTPPNQKIRVQIKFKTESEQSIQTFPNESNKVGRSRSQSFNQRRILENKVRQQFQKTLTSSGYSSAHIEEQYGPFVATTLDPKQILALVHSEEVQHVESYDSRDATDFCPAKLELPQNITIENAKPATKTDQVSSSIDGSGVKIAVLEGGAPLPSASCYNIVHQQDPNPNPAPSESKSKHVSGSLSVISNRAHARRGRFFCDGSLQGIAPGAQIILANGGNVSDPEGDYAHYISRFAYAEDMGAHIVTMSWHGQNEETSNELDARDIFFDYVVTHGNFPSVFTSAGNQGGIPINAYASGKGYNFLGVGVTYLQPNVGNRCSYNEAIHPGSSSRNPATGLDVPEIVAPAHNYDLAHLNYEFGCTSAATPTVASIAALMMDKDSILKSWPEAVRAILLAGADYQEASPGAWNGTTDTKDGAGMVNAHLATEIAGNRQSAGGTVARRGYATGTLKNSRFTGDVFQTRWTTGLSDLNKRFRVALTWNSEAPTPTHIDSLDGDFDLFVTGPGGIEVFSSSINSNYEIVDIPIDAAGDYEIRIQKYGNLSESYNSYFSLAWIELDEPCP